ncbi:MAG: aromatic amino acid lyase [Gammaproteobacteria bacterium]|nr:aromatic amino acid lyase [Gammaproteobacteria bacterium]
MNYKIDGFGLTIETIAALARDSSSEVSIENTILSKIRDSRKLLVDFIDSGKVIYGVNTSMGGFADWLVPTSYANQLQNNLLSAVATNVGNYFSDDVVRAAIISRINSLARGTSAITEVNFKKLVALFNQGIVPCIPEKGSLGASGDLGPLAYIALVCTGKWRAKVAGQLMSGDAALKLKQLEPMVLDYKEGLSLVNGTSVMSGLASLLVDDSLTILKSYEIISALSCEVLKAKLKPFSPIVHSLKPHVGQRKVASNIYGLLKGSKLIIDEDQLSIDLKKKFSAEPKAVSGDAIEDAYSIRCTPQILGPVKDTLEFVKTIVENELNSSNDNPLVVPEHQDFFHNGHFHGQYISMAMDYLSIALTTICNLSDRRIDRFMDKHHSNGLPAFLCRENPGLRLGLMGGQFMSASVTAENRALCVPVSIQTLTTTEDFQDVVSMGLVAARKTRDILTNVYYVIAFELLAACQAADIRGVELLSPAGEKVYRLVREIVPYFDKDEPLTDSIHLLADLIKSKKIVDIVEQDLKICLE